MKKLYVKEDNNDRPLDWSGAASAVFPNLKPTTTPVPLRLPDSVLARLKAKAHARGVPYQSYIKNLLAEDARRA